MRLIDGNKQEVIIEELENICINAPEHVKDLLADLKNQPTVCDIDAIISELKDLIKTVDDMGCPTTQFRQALGIIYHYTKGANYE